MLVANAPEKEGLHNDSWLSLCIATDT